MIDAVDDRERTKRVRQTRRERREMSKDKVLKPIIDNNPMQKGIKRIIFFPPDTKCPNDKKKSKERR